MKFAPICLLLAWLALPALSQDETWYQVELLVFAHNPADIGAMERWPALPELSYPERYRFVTDPAEVAALADEYDGASRLDDRGIQHLTVPAEPVGQLTSDTGGASQVFDPEASSRPASESHPLQTVTLSGVKRLQPALDYEGLRRRWWPSTFSVLQTERLEFGPRARGVAGRGGEVLFHQGWVQPVASQEEALPVIIDRSGDLDIHPRLQGSVTLYRSRYLHLQTNLWLNTLGDYFDLDWQIPAPPLSPPSRVFTVAEAPRSIIQMHPGTAPQPAGTPGNDEVFITEQERAWSGGSITVGESGLLNLETGVLHERLSSRRHPPWRWKHAVKMQQSRRMRSEEVHYMDHPLLGVVVKLTPLEPDELDVFTEPADGTGSKTAVP